MSYADAINRAVQESADQLRDFGGFLAQAGITIAQAHIDHAFSFESWKLVKEGYERQCADYPNG